MHSGRFSPTSYDVKFGSLFCFLTFLFLTFFVFDAFEKAPRKRATGWGGSVNEVKEKQTINETVVDISAIPELQDNDDIPVMVKNILNVAAKSVDFAKCRGVS